MKFSLVFKLVGALIIVGAIVDFFHLHNDIGSISPQKFALHEMHRQVDAQLMLIWFALGIVVTVVGLGFGKLETRVKHHK